LIPDFAICLWILLAKRLSVTAYSPVPVIQMILEVYLNNSFGLIQTFAEGFNPLGVRPKPEKFKIKAFKTFTEAD